MKLPAEVNQQIFTRTIDDKSADDFKVIVSHDVFISDNGSVQHICQSPALTIKNIYNVFDGSKILQNLPCSKFCL